jgi:Tol biopolymer transport system component
MKTFRKIRNRINNCSILLAILALNAVLLLSSAWAIQNSDQLEVELKAAMHKELVDGDLEGAIADYKSLVARAGSDRSIASKALLQIGKCYERLGDEEAKKAYEQLLRDYSDQKEVAAEARSRLTALEVEDRGKDQGSTIRQVWSTTGLKISAVSPDGRYVTFVEDGKLGIRDLAVGSNRILIRKGSYATREYIEDSLFSPDGRQIAFTRHNRDDTWDLCVTDFDGSEPRVLVHRSNGNLIYPAGWSHDGERILVAFFRQSSLGTTSEIAFVSVNGGSVRIIKPAHKAALSSFMSMSLSPDGRYIAYHAESEANSNDLFLLSSDGSLDIPLIQHPADDRAPAWTPDGKNLLFISDRGGTPGFWMIGVKNDEPEGSPVLVKSDIGQMSNRFGFSREGACFYATSTMLEDIYIAALDPASGRVKGEPEELAGRYVGANSEPAWSPEGQYLAFYRQHGPGSWTPGLTKVVIRSVKTGDERELPSSRIQFGRVRWFPDGRSLLVSAFRAEKDWRIDYYRVDVQTGEVSPVLQRENGGNTPWPGLSPEGKTIFFIDGGSVWSHQIDTGQEKELYRLGPLRVRKSLLVSPDGAHLALVDKDAVILVPTEGGQARELLTVSPPAHITANGSMAWTPDGHYLLVVKHSDPSILGELLRIPVDGSEPQKVGLSAMGLRSPAVHPDGDRIAYRAQSKTSPTTFWVMENLLKQGR